MTRIGSILRFALVTGVLLCLVPALATPRARGTTSTTTR